MMKIEFKNKSQSNAEQKQEFLALTPVERIYTFLNLMQRVNRFPTKNKISKKDNFNIIIKTR